MGLFGFLFEVICIIYSLVFGSFAILLFIYEVALVIYKLYYIWIIWQSKDNYIRKARMWLSQAFAPPPPGYSTHARPEIYRPW